MDTGMDNRFVLKEYRTTEGRLLFRIVQHNGSQYLSIKTRGDKRSYLIAVAEMLDDTQEPHIQIDTEQTKA